MPPESELEDEEHDAAIDKAEFCLKLGLQPSEYDLLTDTERDAFIEVANRK